MEKYLQPGVLRLNWYSLGIKDYASSCSKLLKSLTSIVIQMNQMKSDLDSRIDFEQYNLCSIKHDPSDPNFKLLSCKVGYLLKDIKNFDVLSLQIYKIIYTGFLS